MANRNQDQQSDRNRPYGGRDENFDEGDSSARAGAFDEGRGRYGRETEEQSGSTGRYAGYGNWGQGDYDRSSRGANTGQNRYGMTGYGGSGRDQGYGQGNYGQPYQGGEQWNRGESNRGSGRYDREPQDYDRRGESQQSGSQRNWESGSRFDGQRAGSGQSSGYAGPGHGYGESQFGSQGLHRGKGPKGYQRSDERIKEMLSERLREDPHIDASEVTITCQGGKITLDGTVDSRQTKNAIEDVAEQLGIDDVQNNLRVQRGLGSTGSEQSMGGNSPTASGTDKDKGDLSRQRH